MFNFILIIPLIIFLRILRTLKILLKTLLRIIWIIYLKIFFFFIVRLKVKNHNKDNKNLHFLSKKKSKLILISNHASHLDAIAIMSIIPWKINMNFYVGAAKDYFFSNKINSFFSKNILQALPVIRNNISKANNNTLKTYINTLIKSKNIWLLIFPEGTRTTNGYIQNFKKGISVISQKTETPLLFIYLEGTYKLWPKGKKFFKFGEIKLHIGPLQNPASFEEINNNYKKWVLSINNNAYK